MDKGVKLIFKVVHVFFFTPCIWILTYYPVLQCPGSSWVEVFRVFFDLMPWLIALLHSTRLLVAEADNFSLLRSSPITFLHFFFFDPWPPLPETSKDVHFLIQELLRSTWPNQRRRLVRSSFSTSGICSFLRRESDCTRSLSFTPQIHLIIALSVRRILLISLLVIGQHSDA